MGVDIELVEQYRSTQSMNNHRDLTVFIEGNLQQFFDVLMKMEMFTGSSKCNERTYLSIGDDIHLTQTVDVSIGGPKATSSEHHLSPGEK